MVFSKHLAARRAIELLLERGGAMKDRELYEHLRKSYDMSYKEFISLLLYLEINGFINVESIGEDTKAVNLNYKRVGTGLEK
ncbi:MAG: hypothetical protein DJ555_06910 [Desulfurococcaceae archaeon]|nr:MAG: hypothetical protein DJ555_06910 [Desulfurococcaceae archaeon]